MLFFTSFFNNLVFMNGPQIIGISIEVLMAAMCGVGPPTRHPPSRVSFGVRRSIQKVDQC